jgi:hypothetical protein
MDHTPENGLIKTNIWLSSDFPFFIKISMIGFMITYHAENHMNKASLLWISSFAGL